MPGPYGSRANPVRLDPFQQIIGVHWRPTLFAARLNVVLAVTIGGENGPGFGPPFTEAFSHASMTDGTYSYVDDKPLAGFVEFSGGTWRARPSEGIIQSGAPALPGPYSYGLWQWQGINQFGGKEPFLRLGPGDEGTALATPVPDHPDQRFTDGFAGNIILRAQGFVPGGPYESPFGGPGSKWATPQTTGSPLFTPVIQDAESGSVSVSGMTIEVTGKSYAAIGSKVISTEDTGEFWVLFKRETTTS
ncbi:MAG: hypothetical protein EOQ39_03680 [Mesorhizobium sp.]|uniref:hypothetical protein n=1 Tax=Mesorhizobium sp. TaxID=1871066 RepID=UPI000FE58BCD|nr:hypothetical protein [Mesorhizobium sp.]RWB09010.1 MAG: hypothetical protein EOQ37_05835 [Mesorhizobium sp.]RWB17431.1 MAG: hypothetical protein EOQ39_03680 [Mesorhizobium sp.]